MWGFPSDDPGVVHGLIRHLMDKIENRTSQLARFREFYTEDADCLLISYGSAARSARHIVERRRRRGEKFGLLELMTLWPFPYELVKQKAAGARYIVVVEMNTGQICQSVRLAVDRPERVFLANRIDGVLISPTDIQRMLHVIHGRGV